MKNDEEVCQHWKKLFNRTEEFIQQNKKDGFLELIEQSGVYCHIK